MLYKLPWFALWVRWAELHTTAWKSSKFNFIQEIYAIFGRLLDGTGGLYVSVTYPLLIQLIYMLWFNKFYFICGLKFYFLLYIVTQKQRKIKFKPGIKLDNNREIYPRLKVNLPWIKEKKSSWSRACHHLKTSNLSVDDSKKKPDLDGSIPEPQYGLVILVSGYLVLTAFNWPQHGCAISGCRLPHYLARKPEILHWFPCSAGRMVGWTVTWPPKFLGWLDNKILLAGVLCLHALCARMELRYYYYFYLTV